MAVTIFSDDPHLYGARPFVISGTCKREEILNQKQLLKNACNALSQKADDIGRRLYSIASDGDPRRRRATALLTLIHNLGPDSELRAQLGNLALFNYICRIDDETADIDYKHILKRLRNTLLRLKCITLGGVVLTAQLLKRHLLKQGLKDERGINALLSPKDKQDVKLMYDLLSSIAILPPALDTDSPSEQQSRKILRLLGNLYSHLLEVYTNINLSLHQQLVHLSAAAHLILAFYTKEKGGSMPSQLFFDLMTMIKNVYFCVAKTQIDDPDGSFWIILLGSDPLEALFGKVRTIQGNDSNVDQLQLANRTDSAVICTRILAENPDWERGPRRLNLKTWTQEAGDVSAKLDHINPRLWRGNVAVKNVVLLTCWSEGRRVAETQLSGAGWTAPFDEMERGEGFDMFCPFGQNRMVLMDGLTEGERNEDDEEVDIGPPATGATAREQPHPLREDTNIEYEPDLEDMAAEEWIRQDAKGHKLEAYVVVDEDSGGNTSQHKSSVLRIFSNNDPNSTDRLKRVQDFSRFNEAGRGLGLGATSDPYEPKINIEDPAATLVRSKNLIWLAIVQIVDI